jgi:predicted permease
MDTLIQDLRYAARLLGRNPLFALTAMLSLAIGIGANTTIFTIANALLLADPAGVVEGDRVVDIGRSQGGAGFDTNSWPNYVDVRARNTVFTGVYAYRFGPEAMSLGGAAGAERIYGSLVTQNYFDVLGTRAEAGRLFRSGESEQAGATPHAVLSHRFWTRRFGGDPTIAGKTLLLNGRPFTVVGVAEEGFQGTTVFAADLWIPMNMVAEGLPRLSAAMLTDRGSAWLLMGARLKPGVSHAKAQAELESIGASLAREFPRENEGRGLRVLPLSRFPGQVAPIAAFMTGLMGMVSMVLIVACANVAGVLLARATSRRREIAVRLALGAGRGRLVRQMLVETSLLFLGGAVAGLALARVMTSLLVALTPQLPVPVGLAIALDARAVAFTVALSLVAAVLSGIAPAFHASKGDVAGSLKTDSQTSPERMRLRNAFVIAQVTLSIVLVAGAGLFLRALQRASSIDAGFDAGGVDVLSLDLSLAGYTDATGPRFARQLIERARAVPGVEDATLAAMLPLTMGGMGLGRLSRPGVDEQISADWNAIAPDYFATLRTPILRGRDFDERDDAAAPHVAIVNETMARRLWPNEEAVGKTLVQELGPRERRILTVVGVARDAKYRMLGEAPRNYVHVPLWQAYMPQIHLVARSSNGRPLAADLRQLVASLNPNLPLTDSSSLEERSGIALVPQRIAASVTGGLGAVGLLLATIGIYGVTAYLVTSRTREIGIRVALGAQRHDVGGLVLRQGMRLVVTGILIGTVIAAFAGRLAKSLLFGVAATDAFVFAAAAMLFLLAGAAACYVPVRRATAIDAAVALRAD